MPEARQAPFVEITGVSKSYAGVTALSDVGFTLLSRRGGLPRRQRTAAASRP
jgi:ABC-type sugar transport system ATPase subunit